MLDSIIGTIYALPPTGGGGGDQPFWVQLLPLALIVVVFYFLLIRPQQKKAKVQRELIASLKKGDKVILTTGIYGTIKNISKDGWEETEFTGFVGHLLVDISLEIADKTIVRVRREFVSNKIN